MEPQDLKDGVFVGITDPDNKSKLLLVKHKYNDGKWSLPGGGIRQGEIVTHAAIRETLEEARIHISQLLLVGIFTLRKKYGLVVLFEAIEWDGIPIPGTDNLEIQEARFLSLADIEANKEIQVYPAQIALMKIFFNEKIREGKVLYGYLTDPPHIINI